jgi:hypothetical protein
LFSINPALTLIPAAAELQTTPTRWTPVRPVAQIRSHDQRPDEIVIVSGTMRVCTALLVAMLHGFELDTPGNTVSTVAEVRATPQSSND